ncbi:transketolase-like TK C-terminal-containing protein [Glutamicibacter protophormiae]|uniref:transketolase-like TK C-terminal-containing protein n=1 Tax=Glutamicibacter protophormiae TaxID=37930 RepID=UPI003A956EB2
MGRVRRVWSVTSWNELTRDGLHADEQVLVDPSKARRVPYVTQKLSSATGPFIATTDYMRAVPEQIRPYVPGEYHTLSADGFGFSDTRSAARRASRSTRTRWSCRPCTRWWAREIATARLSRRTPKYDLNTPNAARPGTGGGDAKAHGPSTSNAGKPACPNPLRAGRLAVCGRCASSVRASPKMPQR